MNDQVTGRLGMLKLEFTRGQVRLQQLERQEAALREMLLRLTRVRDAVRGYTSDQPRRRYRVIPIASVPPVDPSLVKSICRSTADGRLVVMRAETARLG